jgi:hypothetical protein
MLLFWDENEFESELFIVIVQSALPAALREPVDTVFWQVGENT